MVAIPELEATPAVAQATECRNQEYCLLMMIETFVNY
jgi:hypothetical protein